MTDSPMVGRRLDGPMEPYRMEPPMCPIPNDWSRYGLDEIWRMLQHHSPAAGEAAASMWKTIEILCQEQAERLRAALRALEARWPADQAASRAFQMWGQSLVQAMELTADTARLNRPVPANISEEINHARQRVAALISDRTYYQELEQSGGSLTANAVNFGRELFDGDVAFSSWRSRLDRDAREVMADLEQKIFNYARHLYADPPYKPPLAQPEDLPEASHDLGAATAGWNGSSFVPAGGWPGGWEPGTSTGGVPSGGDPASGGDPGLDGDTVLDGVTPSPAGAGPLAGGGLPGPAGVFVDTPWGRVLAPGGVIGAPGAGGVGAMPGGPGAAAGPASAGLAPGTGSAARTPAGSGMVPFMPPMAPGRPGATGVAGTASGRRSRRGLPSVFDSPSGPPGVIQPAPEPAEHDPGPGVIGIDR